MCAYTAVDIFSGAGGMSIGAKLAGINPVLAIELDQAAAATYARNHVNVKVLQQDISVVNPLEHVESSPFVLFGGPPCQGFSTANTKTRNLENPNNWMFKEYLRFVKLLKPNWFVFENVEGFKSFSRGLVATEVESALKKLGYVTNSTVLNASDYGVPQKRFRFFIIGHRLDLGGIYFDFDKIEKKTLVTVGDAISDLPILSNGSKWDVLQYRSEPKSLYAQTMRLESQLALQNYVSENKDYVIERYKVIKQGQNWKAAKENGLLGTYKSTENTHSGIYRRLSNDEPSVTISNYRKSMLIHPVENRGFSLREIARLQSFPDKFIFEGKLGNQQQQVSNAVPPLLAKAVFEQILKLEKDRI